MNPFGKLRAGLKVNPYIENRKEIMLIEILKSKIHRARVTEANLQYAGSITIDEKLMAAANLLAGEKVQVVNLHNGERFETYVIKGKKNSGVICLNGPAARLGQVGDLVIILAYAQMTPEEAKKFHPKLVKVNEKNQLK